jgi:hypothetical protein
MSLQLFRVTLVGFSLAESVSVEEALRRIPGPLTFTVKREPTAAAASFPLDEVHAIVFTQTGLAQATAADVETIRSATEPGTCRAYVLESDRLASSVAGSPLDDFIQRTSIRDVDSLANQICRYFREADDINRRSAPLALRDITCLRAYEVLKLLWPLSYLFVAFHVSNTAAMWAGLALLLTLTNQYVITAANFFGAFFIVHSFYVALRNALFGARIIKVNWLWSYVWHTAGLGILCVGTAYSMAASNNGGSRIIVSFVLAVGAYVSYLYVRTIRAECSSLSQLQADMVEPLQRVKVLKEIGEMRLGPDAFPLRPFKSKALFISYMHRSSWSSETADLIQSWAVKDGLDVFLDRSSIPSGTLWRQTLLRFLSECGYFVAVLDDEEEATAWVLGESAYAAILRKSVGKPRILVVARNAAGVISLQRGPFGLIYREVFELGSSCLGATVLTTERASPQLVVETLQRIPQMALLGATGSQWFPRDDLIVPNAQEEGSAAVNDQVELADDSWRTSLLLVTLLDHAGGDEGSLNLLTTKSVDWLRAGSPRQKTIALNLLRGLFKVRHVSRSQDVLKLVVELFVTDASLPVKLAAIDLLAAVKSTNPVSRLSSEERKRLMDFRSTLMNSKNASQRRYAASGVHADVARQVSVSTPRQAMLDVLVRVDSVS